MKRKKPEYVQGAWLYILATVAFVFGCAITGADPQKISSLGLVLPIVIIFVFVFAAIVAIISGILGGGK